MSSPSSPRPRSSFWQEKLQDHCRSAQLLPPVFNIVSDRRGKATSAYPHTSSALFQTIIPIPFASWSLYKPLDLNSAHRLQFHFYALVPHVKSPLCFPTFPWLELTRSPSWFLSLLYLVFFVDPSYPLTSIVLPPLLTPFPLRHFTHHISHFIHPNSFSLYRHQSLFLSFPIIARLFFYRHLFPPPIPLTLFSSSGGRTAWSSTVTIPLSPHVPTSAHTVSARYWYDGQYVDNAKEDAAEVALRTLTTGSPGGGNASAGASGAGSWGGRGGGGGGGQQGWGKSF